MAENSKYIELLDQALEKVLGRDPDAALALCEEAMKIDAARAEHLFLLGIVSLDMNDSGRAIKFMEEGHRREPDWLEFAQALTILHAETGNLSASLYFSKLEFVLESNPTIKNWVPETFGNFFEALEGLKLPTHMVNGWVDFHHRNFSGAVAYCEREMALNAENDDCYLLYGRALMELHEYDRSISALQTAIRLNPDHLEHHIYYADALLAAGYPQQSVDACRQALNSHTESIELRTRLICALSYCPAENSSLHAGEIEKLGDRLICGLPDRAEKPDTERPKKLCVGFIINEYAVSEYPEFLGTLFQSHDRSKYRFVGYQQYSQPFGGTVFFSNAMDDWCKTYDINDPTLAHIIKNDGVDVLVDVCGLQSGNRLEMLAGLSDVVRVNWLGFPLIAHPSWADVMLCDDASTALFGSLNPGLKVETLGECIVGYAGGSAALDVNADDPHLVSSNDRIVFGAALDLKIIEQSATLWAEVIKGVDGSQLLLGGTGAVFEGTIKRVENIFAELGIADRVSVQDSESSHSSRGLLLSDIDIFLDAQLVSRATLVADALWMGVPVVTIREDRPTSCLGANILEAAGHNDWIAENPSQYLKIAQALAKDGSGRAELRSRLRDQLKQSKLCNVNRFARLFTDALDRVWASNIK